MTGILKVDTIQKNNGSQPTAGDLGLSGAVVNIQIIQGPGGGGASTTASGKVNLGLGGTYTKRNSSNKVLIIADAGIFFNDSDSNAWDTAVLMLYIDGSQAIIGPTFGTNESASAWRGTHSSVKYIVSNSNPTILVEFGTWNLSTAGAYVGIQSAHYDGIPWQLTFIEFTA